MRKQITGMLCAILTVGLLYAAEVKETTNLLKNSGFELVNSINGVEEPEGWRLGKYSGGIGNLVVDKKIIHGGKHSARIAKDNKDGWVQLYQTKYIAPLKKERKLRITAWVSSEETVKGAIVFFGNTKEKKQAQWLRIQSFKGTFGWKKISKVITVKPGIKTLTLSIRLIGKGLLWVDDCSMEFMPDEKKKIDTSTNLIENPTFSGPLEPETGLPKGWLAKRVHGLETVCNYERNHDSVLALTWKHGGPRFGIQPVLKDTIKGNNSFEFSATAKTTGSSNAVLIAQALDAQGNIIFARKSQPLKSKDWNKCHLLITTPKETATLNVYCFNEGQGTVFYKNAALKYSEHKESKVFPIQAQALPVEGTKVWNNGKAEFNTFINSPCPLSFDMKGRVKGLVNPAFVIELPQGVNVAECVSIHPHLLSTEKPVIEKGVRDGQAYQKFIFTSPKVFNIIKPTYSWGRKLVMALLPEDDSFIGNNFNAYWYLQAENAGKGPEHIINVNILPPLKKIKNPQNFPYLCWSTLDLNFNDPNLVDKIASNYEEANMAYRMRTFAKGRTLDTQLENRGWVMCIGNPDYIHTSFLRGGNWDSIKSDIEYAVYADGSKKPNTICPQYFIHDQDLLNYFKTFYKDTLKSRGVKDGEMVILDIEPWGTMDWCFCKRCLNDFAAKNKLSTVPTPKEIKKTYKSQWRDFRCENTTKMIKMYADIIRKNYPKSAIMDYDYVTNFDSPNYKDFFYSVAKDPLGYEPYIDAHLSSYYHYIDKDAFDMIDLNVKNLKKDYWVIGAIDKTGYISSREVITPSQLRMLILASAASGAKGFGIFPGKHIDGKFFVETNKAMGEVAELEQFFKIGIRKEDDVNVAALPYFSADIMVNGKKKTISRPNWKQYFGYRVHKLNSDYLISLFNYNKEKPLFVDIKMSLPTGDYTILNPVTKVCYTPSENEKKWTAKNIAEGVYANVPAMDTTFLLVRKQHDSDTQLSYCLTSKTLYDDYLKYKEKSTEKKSFIKPVSKNDLSISYDQDKNGELSITMASNQQKVWVNPESGGVLSKWTVGNTSLCCDKKAIAPNANSLFWDFFWLPKEMRRDGSELAKMKVIKADIVGNKASLSLENNNIKNGLVLTKTYSIHAGSKSLEIDYSILNNGPKTVEFSFWSHNFFKLGNRDKLMDEMAAVLPLDKGMTSIAGEKASLAFPVDPSNHPGFNKKAVGGILTNGTFGVYALKENIGIRITTDYQQLMMAYVWCAANPTLEWMYKQTTLSPGQTWKTQVKLTFEDNCTYEQFSKSLKE